MISDGQRVALICCRLRFALSQRVHQCEAIARDSSTTAPWYQFVRLTQRASDDSVNGGRRSVSLAMDTDRAKGETMQRNNGFGRYHTVRAHVHPASIRLAAGSLVASLVAIILAPGAAAETLDALNAGNGGTATTSATSTLTAGDIYGGGNNGNTIIMGDLVNSTVEVNGGTVTNPTYNILAMPAGTQIATANGGDDTQARLDEAGPPIDLEIDVRSKNSNENTSTSTSNATNTNISDNANANVNENEVVVPIPPPPPG